jgi:acetyltransferase-like isoleucine patch superfamily enzyme
MSEKYIDGSAKVENGVSIGNGTNIWRNCQVRKGAYIGDNCVLSKDVYIGIGVDIGEGCKIQNGVSVFEGVTLENNVFCGPHMTFTNDRNIRINPSEYNPIPTYVEEWASIGAHATILPGITIGKYAVVGAQSLVTKDVPAFALVYGNPARIQGIVCYCGEKLISAEEMGEESEFRCSECGEVVNINREAFSERANS